MSKKITLFFVLTCLLSVFMTGCQQGEPTDNEIMSLIHEKHTNRAFPARNFVMVGKVQCEVSSSLEVRGVTDHWIFSYDYEEQVNNQWYSETGYGRLLLRNGVWELGGDAGIAC